MQATIQSLVLLRKVTHAIKRRPFPEFSNAMERLGEPGLFVDKVSLLVKVRDPVMILLTPWYITVSSPLESFLYSKRQLHQVRRWLR